MLGICEREKVFDFVFDYIKALIYFIVNGKASGDVESLL